MIRRLGSVCDILYKRHVQTYTYTRPIQTRVYVYASNILVRSVNNSINVIFIQSHVLFVYISMSTYTFPMQINIWFCVLRDLRCSRHIRIFTLLPLPFYLR